MDIHHWPPPSFGLSYIVHMKLFYLFILLVCLFLYSIIPVEQRVYFLMGRGKGVVSDFN